MLVRKLFQFLFALLCLRFFLLVGGIPHVLVSYCFFTPSAAHSRFLSTIFASIALRIYLPVSLILMYILFVSVRMIFVLFLIVFSRIVMAFFCRTTSAFYLYMYKRAILIRHVALLNKHDKKITNKFALIASTHIFSIILLRQVFRLCGLSRLSGLFPISC